jgi:hypothetical protein
MRVAILGFLLAVAAGGVVWAAVKPGETRAIQPRDGVSLRSSPKPLGPRVETLAFGARVTVQEVQGDWARVAAPSGAVGWVRTSDLVEAGALTSASARTGAVASADVSLAGRQFDEATEQGYRATKADLDAAYRLVDEIERHTLRPDSPVVEAFIREGRLGGVR